MNKPFLTSFIFSTSNSVPIGIKVMGDFVLGLCEKELIAKTILKKDVEGFFSAFNYNQYGATNIHDVAGLVYTRDDEIPQRLAERKRPNAPPQDLNRDVDPKSVEEKEVHTQRIRSLLNQMEDKVFNGKVKLIQVFRQFDKDLRHRARKHCFLRHARKLTTFALARARRLASIATLCARRSKHC